MSAEGKGLGNDTDKFALNVTITAKALCGEVVQAGAVFKCQNGICFASAYSDERLNTLKVLRAGSLALLNKETKGGRGEHLFDSSTSTTLTVSARGTVCAFDCPYIPPDQSSSKLITPEKEISVFGDDES